MVASTKTYGYVDADIAKQCSIDTPGDVSGEEVIDEPVTPSKRSPTLIKRSRTAPHHEVGKKFSSATRPSHMVRSPSVVHLLAAKFAKKRDKLKNVFSKSKISKDDPGGATPILVSLEPLVNLTAGDCHEARVQYRAKFRLLTKSGEHEWQTDPFSLDDLLSVVVSTRMADACNLWCSSRSDGDQRKTTDGRRSASLSRCQRLRSWLWRRAGCIVLWTVFLFLAWSLVLLLRPAARFLSSRTWLQLGDQNGQVLGNMDWLVASGLSMTILGVLVGLFAGATEMSFLPAKVFLQLERKDETAQVREQLHLLLNRKDCVQNLDVCNFLNLGLATYYGSSETNKEGRCLCRLHASPDVYFTKSRRRRCPLLCISISVDMRCHSRRRSGLVERWLVLRKDGLALFSSIMHEDPTDMLFFDTSFSLYRHEEGRVLVCGAQWVLELDFGEDISSERRVASWCKAITITAQQSPRTHEQRFGSFAPIRYPAQAKLGDRHVLRRSLARFLVCGRAAFRKIAESILIAQHEIFVLGWFITPHLPLVREGDPIPNEANPTLSILLRGAADRGVRVCVLIYQETGGVLPNDSEWVESELRHPNVFVVRHRSRFDANRLWSHHEKVVVVDQQLAFLGGLDLCLGRYDNASHPLRDDAPPLIWAGQDYANPRIRDFSDVRNTGSVDTLDRRQQSRSPWQDVHCALLGKPARDVARHCIERWNHAKTKRPQYCKYPTALLRRKIAVCNDRIVDIVAERGDTSWPKEFGSWCACTAQVVRSVGRWSAGTGTESSVHAAYCNLIQEAERFIYIENQFFCSGMDGDESIGNRVVEAIYLRVVRAHTHREDFHVMIVLPLLPALDGPISNNVATPLLCVMRWQYWTLRGLRQRLADVGIPMEKYVSIYSLRTYGHLADVGYVTEQIYIHSKVLIVDDRWAVVGSANVNDRSLLGLRDSELCVVLRDGNTEEVLLGRTGGFAAKLRRALFAQHLGSARDGFEDRFADPSSEDTLSAVRSIARRNTEIYEELFGALPSDSIPTWSVLAARTTAAVADGQAATQGDATKRPSSEAEAVRLLAEVQGHIVNFPLDFLVEEDLSPPTFSVGGLTPDAFN